MPKRPKPLTVEARTDAGKLVIEQHDTRLRASIEWAKYPPSRGFVTGSEPGKAQFFDWNTAVPLGLERADGKVIAIQIASNVFRRA